MMKIFILPKRHFEGLLKVLKDDNKEIGELKNAFFISLMDPEFPDPLHEELPNYKTIWCYDIEEDIDNFKAISQDEIQELYDFIWDNHDKEVCYVHCSAGVSRSGAVGTFINDLFGENYKDFKKRHPYIHPNGRILRLLNRLEREKNTGAGFQGNTHTDGLSGFRG